MNHDRSNHHFHRMHGIILCPMSLGFQQLRGVLVMTKGLVSVTVTD